MCLKLFHVNVILLESTAMAIHGHPWPSMWLSFPAHPGPTCGGPGRPLRLQRPPPRPRQVLPRREQLQPTASAADRDTRSSHLLRRRPQKFEAVKALAALSSAQMTQMNSNEPMNIMKYHEISWAFVWRCFQKSQLEYIGNINQLGISDLYWWHDVFSIVLTWQPALAQQRCHCMAKGNAWPPWLLVCPIPWWSARPTPTKRTKSWSQPPSSHHNLDLVYRVSFHYLVLCLCSDQCYVVALKSWLPRGSLSMARFFANSRSCAGARATGGQTFGGTLWAWENQRMRR